MPKKQSSIFELLFSLSLSLFEERFKKLALAAAVALEQDVAVDTGWPSRRSFRTWDKEEDEAPARRQFEVAPMALGRGNRRPRRRHDDSDDDDERRCCRCRCPCLLSR